MSIGTLSYFDILTKKNRLSDGRSGEGGDRGAREAVAAHNAIMRSLMCDLADSTTARDAEADRPAPTPGRVETWHDRPPLL
jgi:hypothetical protein